MTNEEQKILATGIQDILSMVVWDEVRERCYELVDELNLEDAMDLVSFGSYAAVRSSFETDAN